MENKFETVPYCTVEPGDTVYLRGGFRVVRAVVKIDDARYLVVLVDDTPTLIGYGDICNDVVLMRASHVEAVVALAASFGGVEVVPS